MSKSSKAKLAKEPTIIESIDKFNIQNNLALVHTNNN